MTVDSNNGESVLGTYRKKLHEIREVEARLKVCILLSVEIVTKCIYSKYIQN